MNDFAQSPAISRYQRHDLVLTEELNIKIQKTTALVVGAGGVASSCLEFLCSAGMNLIIVDYDVVELHNLHRQVIHSTASIGVNKALSAQSRLLDLNPSIKIDTIMEKLTPDNINQLLSKFSFEVLIDTTDNPAARYLVADYCKRKQIPHVFASGCRFSFQISSFNVFEDHSAPCFRCMFGDSVPKQLQMTAATAGVFGPMVGVVGSLAAAEILKIVAYKGDAKKLRENCLQGKLVFGDLQKISMKVVSFSRKLTCERHGNNGEQ